jgi:hypothetical protein
VGVKARPRRTPARRAPRATYASARLEFDLRHEQLRSGRLPVIGQIEALLREREVEERVSVVPLAAALLHAMAGLGYRHVDHWEIHPGGWLPLPERTHPGLVEPVGHLVRALASESWRPLVRARRLAVRLSAADGRRADVVLRRVHREREHSLTVELVGAVTAPQVRRTVAAVRSRLPVLRVRLAGVSTEK